MHNTIRQITSSVKWFINYFSLSSFRIYKLIRLDVDLEERLKELEETLGEMMKGNLGNL